MVFLLAHTDPTAHAQRTQTPTAVSKGARLSTTVTFNGEVAAILYRRCYACHCAHGSAPFALADYKDAAKHAAQIAQVTANRFMPPWKPARGYGEFADAQALDDAEIDTLKRWTTQGAMEGRAQDRPSLPHPLEGWRLGTPDKVITMPQACTIPAEGMDITRSFVLPLKLPADTWIRAVEVLPQNRRVVRDTRCYLDNTRMARRLQQQIGTIGYASMGGPGLLPTNTERDWLPGAMPDFFIPGVAAALKGDTDLILLTHFHPTGKPETEQSSVGLYLSATPPQRELAIITLGSNRIFIHPGQKDYVVRDSFTLPVAVDIYGMLPHAHYICTEIKCVATLPDGTVRPLLWIKDWDYDWQRAYRTRSPVRLPVGTIVTAEFRYDNSVDNPRNPNHPPRFVMWGGQTMDEMAGLWLQAVPLSRADNALLARTLTSRALQLARSMHLTGHARAANRVRIRPTQQPY